MTPDNSRPPTPDDLRDQLAELFGIHGASLYAGEPVTQLEHALQAASLAEEEGRPAVEIVAALLHDVGHLIHDLGEDCAARGIDDTHEVAGAQWLSERFDVPERVTVPIRMHVPAKRFLCAVEPAYHQSLSAASQLSLTLQGGPMSDDEVAGFRQTPYSDSAVRLRRWDDAAKVPDLATPSLSHFLNLIDRELLQP